MEDAKATFKIVLFFALLGIAIIVPFVVFQDLNYDDEDFPEFQNINISKSDLEDEFEYDKIRTQLESDIYFRKLTTMVEYDSERFTSEHLDKLVWHFIFNYEINNIDNFYQTDFENQVFCLKKENFIDAFEELYNADVKNYTYLLKGYYQYVYERSKGYCLDFGNVAKDYDNDVRIAVERMAYVGSTLTADVYVYEYYTPSNKDENVYDLENAIAAKNYTGANHIVKTKLYGKTTHKTIRFKINKRGKYFKYTIVSVDNLDY